MQGWTRTKREIGRIKEKGGGGGEEGMFHFGEQMHKKEGRGVGRGVVAWGSERESFLLLYNI